jgi:hypothetical protein
MKNKLQTKTDAYLLIDRLDRVLLNKKISFEKSFFNKNLRHDILLIKEILKTDYAIQLNIKKKFIGFQYLFFVFCLLIPTCLVLMSWIFSRFIRMKYMIRGNLDGIFYRLGDQITDCVYLPSLLLIFIYFWKLGEISSEYDFVCLLRWYKENIKKRSKWEINNMLQQVHIHWYKKIFVFIFGIWTIYVLKENPSSTDNV